MGTTAAPGKLAQFKRYLSGADLDEANTGADAVERLPNPLPNRVGSVARLQLAINGAWLAIMLLALASGAIAIVVMPFAMGREGVGMAMVSMFGLSISAVLSAIPFFAARGAARLLRRDARGVGAVYRTAWFVLLFVLPASFAAVWVLRFQSMTESSAEEQSLLPTLIPMLFLATVTAVAACAAWTIWVLGRYRRTVR